MLIVLHAIGVHNEVEIFIILKNNMMNVNRNKKDLFGKNANSGKNLNKYSKLDFLANGFKEDTFFIYSFRFI